MFAMKSSWAVHKVLWDMGRKIHFMPSLLFSEMYGTGYKENYAPLMEH
jgi:hypothetical protein